MADLSEIDAADMAEVSRELGAVAVVVDAYRFVHAWYGPDHVSTAHFEVLNHLHDDQVVILGG